MDASSSIQEDNICIEDGLVNNQRVNENKGNAFKCSECDKSFTRKARLMKHMFVHTNEKPLECEKCGRHYTNIVNYKKHVEGDNGLKEYPCKSCGEKFSDCVDHKKHVLMHKRMNGRKSSQFLREKLVCEVCSRSFVSKLSLGNHLRIHTGEKPFPCKVCDKNFSGNSSLRKHMRIHKQEKPFCCPECGKMFTQSGHIQVHMRSHTGEKPYSCLICGQRFVVSGGLKKHMRLHTGERPYSCFECGETFAQIYNLRVHEKNFHSDGKDHCCEQCGASFRWRESYVKHLQTHTRGRGVASKYADKYVHSIEIQVQPDITPEILCDEESSNLEVQEEEEEATIEEVFIKVEKEDEEIEDQGIYW